MSTHSTPQFTIGNYRVGKSIGQGTFGKVRLGIHIPTDQKVAVKTLQKQKIVEQADIERVTRQICILKILRHPNIIQLYEIIETKTDIHLIMEYAEGGELFDYIVKKKRLDQTEAIFFMQQLLAGVEYIHKNGIVHRDLKPENLLLDQNKSLKIVDFGLSNQYKPGQRLKTACGSPCYAAPEMIAGKKYECLNVDIWSCGIILYAMLCGYLPFQDPNTNKLYKKIMSGDYEQPKVLTPDSKQILKNILNVNPETRFNIEKIRQSKWYNLTGKKYLQRGILVGTDHIQPNETLIQIMTKQGMDPSQIRNYVINNRHNQISAYYYLLQKKVQNEPPSPNKHARTDSPLIYRPDIPKQPLLQQRKPSAKQPKDTSRNDSFNASNIISSLVEANKNKLVNTQTTKPPKKDNFNKMDDVKLFPKKKAGSIYEPNVHALTNKGAITSRSDVEQKLDFSSNRNSWAQNDKISLAFKDKPRPQPEPDKEQELHVNKKRQELSDQLKQISIKIDKEIVELRKQNNSGLATLPNHSPSPKFKQPLSASLHTKKIKGHPSNLNTTNGAITDRQPSYSAKQSLEFNSAKLSDFRQSQAGRPPKMHLGPFNSQCLFYDNPHSILLRVIDCLSNRLNMKYQQIDPYTLRLSEYEIISVQALPGVNGYYLIKFSTYSSLNQTIINYLSK